MKKLTLLGCIVVAMIVVSGCKSSNPYAGTYVGTLSSTVGNVNKENLKMIFTAGVIDETNLNLYGLPLTKLSEEKYKAEGELVVKIIQLVSSSTTLDQIKDATFVFEFSDGAVKMDARYEVLGGLADINVMTYQGKKQ